MWILTKSFLWLIVFWASYLLKGCWFILIYLANHSASNTDQYKPYLLGPTLKTATSLQVPFASLPSFFYQECRKSNGQPPAGRRTLDTGRAAFPARYHHWAGIGITKFAHICEGIALAHYEVWLQFMEFYLTHHTKSMVIYSMASIFFFFFSEKSIIAKTPNQWHHPHFYMFIRGHFKGYTNYAFSAYIWPWR